MSLTHTFIKNLPVVSHVAHIDSETILFVCPCESPEMFPPVRVSSGVCSVDVGWSAPGASCLGVGAHSAQCQSVTISVLPLI